MLPCLCSDHKVHFTLIKKWILLGSVHLCWVFFCHIPEWRQNPSFQPHTELTSLWSEAQIRWEWCCFTNTWCQCAGQHGRHCTLEDGAHFGLSLYYRHILVVRGRKCLCIKILLPVANTCYPVKLITVVQCYSQAFYPYCCLLLHSWLWGLNCIWFRKQYMATKNVLYFLLFTKRCYIFPI